MKDVVLLEELGEDVSPIYYGVKLPNFFKKSLMTGLLKVQNKIDKLEEDLESITEETKEILEKVRMVKLFENV